MRDPGELTISVALCSIVRSSSALVSHGCFQAFAPLCVVQEEQRLQRLFGRGPWHEKLKETRKSSAPRVNPRGVFQHHAWKSEKLSEVR